MDNLDPENDAAVDPAFLAELREADPQDANSLHVGDVEAEGNVHAGGLNTTNIDESAGIASPFEALEPPPENTVGLDNALWLARVHDLPILDAYEKDGSLHPGRSFDRRTTDPETIKRWFTDALGQPNERNVAIVMGLWNGRRRIGFDFDGKDGRPGIENYKIMLDAGLIPANSLTFRTKSNGLHVVAEVEDGLWLAMNAVNWKGEGVEELNLIDRDGSTGVDIRGENGVLYTVGSEMFGGGAYKVERNARIAPLPAKDVAVFGSARKAAPARGEARVAEGVEIDSDGNRARAMTYLVNEAPRAMQGAGGRRVSMAVLQRLLDFGCSYDEAIDLMLEYWNKAKADPPWDDDELRAPHSAGSRGPDKRLSAREAPRAYSMSGTLRSRRPSNGSGSRRPRPTAPRVDRERSKKKPANDNAASGFYERGSAKTTANILNLSGKAPATMRNPAPVSTGARSVHKKKEPGRGARRAGETTIPTMTGKRKTPPISQPSRSLILSKAT